MRHLIFFIYLLLPISVMAGNFFPPEYKSFPFKEGDLLVSKRADGKFAVNKILKVDRFDLKKGSAINIQGQRFVVTEDDHLLVISAAYGESEFNSFDEASTAAKLGEWTLKMGHVPNRAPGAADGQTRVSHRPVLQSELTGYQQWRQAFEKGEAGIF